MAKQYYWLRLKEDFFKSVPMKKLRKIAGGEIYTIIYLKMQLLSLRDEGSIFLEGVGDFSEELSLALDEEPENVKVLLKYLESVGLLEYKSPDEIFLTEVPYLIGKETDKAQMMRRLREERKQNMLADGNNVTDALPDGNNVTEGLPNVTFCYTEKEKEKEKDEDLEKETPTTTKNITLSVLHNYGTNGNVKLTEAQLKKLWKEFGIDDVNRTITRLDDYIQNKGTYYPNHSDVISKWIVEDRQKAKGGAF